MDCPVVPSAMASSSLPVPRSAVDPRAWLLGLVVGGGLLTFGNLLLFLGPLGWVVSGSDALFVLRFPGTMAVSSSWLFLILATALVPSTPSAGGRRLRARLGLSLFAAILGFVAGLATLPFAFPQREGGLLFDVLWQYIASYGYFPYVPSVFAPIGLGHAGFTVTASRGFALRRDRDLAGIGAVFLAASSLVALTIQLAGGFDGAAYLLVGGLLPGYGLMTLVALREFGHSAIAGPSRGPATPSQGPSP